MLAGGAGAALRSRITACKAEASAASVLVPVRPSRPTRNSLLLARVSIFEVFFGKCFGQVGRILQLIGDLLDPPNRVNKT